MDTLKNKDFPARHWRHLPDGRIECHVCPRFCKLQEDQHGLCFVRMRKNNQMILTTYGRSTGYAIDPVEKKPLYHFLPGTSVYSFGTIGCNFTCHFCQNWRSSQSKDMNQLSPMVTPESVAQAAEQNDCESIAFTYNEPTIFMEYAIDVAKAAHERGIKAIAVTNGYIAPEARKEFYSYMDAANLDLKAFTEDFYQKITGGHLAPILDTLRYLKHETNVWLEVTTLLIPGKNDSQKEIAALLEWFVKNLGVGVPLHFSAFYPAFKMLDIPPTPFNTLIQARKMALDAGLRYVYTGNVGYPEGHTTFCHHCHRAIIERLDYEIIKYHLTDNGHCEYCQTRCAGIFEPQKKEK